MRAPSHTSTLMRSAFGAHTSKRTPSSMTVAPRVRLHASGGVAWRTSCMTPRYVSRDTSDIGRAVPVVRTNPVGAFFRRIAERSASAMGSPWTFVLAVLGCVVWAAAGPVCHYSDTWQLTINTGTTVLTFL